MVVFCTGTVLRLLKSGTDPERDILLGCVNHLLESIALTTGEVLTGCQVSGPGLAKAGPVAMLFV